MLDDRRKLVGFVSNARVVCERDPTARRYVSQPFVVFAIVHKVVGVSLDGESGIA